MWNTTSFDGSNAGPDPSDVTNADAKTKNMDSAHAFIGKTMTIKGEISGAESIVIDGKVDGSIKLAGKSLRVGAGGSVTADVEASEIIISGHLKGKVSKAERVDIRSGGSLDGDVATRRISIEEGAQFSGSIDMQGANSQSSANSVNSKSMQAPQPSPNPVMAAAPVPSLQPVGVAAGGRGEKDKESVGSNLAIGRPIP